MKPRKIGLGLIAIGALTLAAAPVADASVVPPGNSAATQYTEAIPTVGGPTTTGKKQDQAKRSPTQVLGRRNAHHLEARGTTGRAVAEVAAQTAPALLGELAGRPGGVPSAGGVATTHNGTGSGSEIGAHRPTGQTGSSGLGEVISHATGSSGSGGIGLLLPLAIAGALVWACVYWLRQRRQPAA